MSRVGRQRGSALILFLGISAALAILATTLVLVVGNQQHATAAERTRNQSFDYAEAGLESAVMAVRSATWPEAGESFSDAALRAAYDATYPAASRPTLQVKVYDNQATVDEAITWDKGGPTAATTPDGKLWVEAKVTYNKKTTRLRQLVGQVNSTSSLSLPAAALYTDGDIMVGPNGSGDVYAVKADGTPAVGPPFSASVYGGGEFVGNWSSDLSPNGGNATLEVKTNGTVYNPAEYGDTQEHPGTGGVAPLSTYLPQNTIDTLTAEAKTGTPPKANAQGTVVGAALLAQLQATSPQTYTASDDLVVNGDLTLGGGESWFNFKSLYVTGNLTLNGNTHTNTTALYVGGNFTISGPSGTSQFGSIYVGGNVDWGGALTVKTTDYTDAGKDPAPMYVGGSFKSQGGPFTHVLGPTYVAGACTFSGNNALIMCPLLVSPSQITTSGSASFGTVDQPMVLLGLDNSDGQNKDIQLGANGTFTGVIINMDGGVTFSNSANPDVRGAVFAEGTITFSGNTKVEYNPNVLANLDVSAATTVTTVVPGTWQELPAN